MKKIFKFLPMFCLALILPFIFSGCSIGSYIVKFQSYTSNEFEKQYYTPGDMINTLPTPSKYGYNFLYWSKDANGTSKVTTPLLSGNFTLYAIYEINETIFSESNTVNWTGSSSMTIDAKYAILLKKTSTSNSFSKITIMPTGEIFRFSNIEVFDSLGKPVEDKNKAFDTWEAKKPIKASETGNYVIYISGFYGNFSLILQ